MCGMFGFIAGVALFASSYFGTVQGDYTRVSWEAVPSTKRSENRWLHTADYRRKEQATRRAICALKCSKFIEAMGGRIVNLDIAPGWWEGISNPSVQMDVTGLSPAEADYLAAVVGKALYQDGVGYHALSRVAASPADANILRVDLTRNVTARDLAALEQSLKAKFGDKAWGVALVPGEKEMRVLNISGGEIANADMVAWAGESLPGALLGLHGGIHKWVGTTGFQSAEQYESTLRQLGVDNPRESARRGNMFLVNARDILDVPLQKRAPSRWARGAFDGLNDRLQMARGLCPCKN